MTLTLAVLVEATPFIVLGIIFSVVVTNYVPSEWFIKYLPKTPFLRRLTISLFGIFMPVCECGNVPLARGLLMKGLKSSDVITFLLSAPIMNPITITTTVLAFASFDSSIVVLRILGGIAIANIVGYVFSGLKKTAILKQTFINHCDHHHQEVNRFSIRDFSKKFTNEANAMMPPLVVGAMVAGLSQVIVPRSVLTSIGGNVVISVVIMMLLAFVVSICASVDAFFALAYATSFTPGAIVAFLVFGPMIDIKMLSLMSTTFTRTTLVKITVLVALLTMILGLGVNYAL